MTTPGSPSPGGAYVLGSHYGSDLTEESAKAIMKGGTVSSFTGAQNAMNTQYRAVMDDHSQSITDLRQKYNRIILQGNAIVFPSNGTYTPTAGIRSVDVILIGAGAKGGNGFGDAAGNRSGGGGGGGGGEVHVNIPSSLLPVDNNGNFQPIAITVGAGGSTPSQGGGNTSFGSFLDGGGGQGGGPANTAQGGVGGQGGAGMVTGGEGGTGVRGGQNPASATQPGASTSAYDLHGGGGGGGGGGAQLNTVGPTAGGVGGISPGGAPGQTGSQPSSIIATGAGGGGGSTGGTGAAGAYPAGGGGGGWGGFNSATSGGNGGNGIVYIIERTT